MAPGKLRVGFWLVFARELRWLRRRPVLACLTTIFPLALLVLLAVIFSAGLPTRLPIAVLDQDQSELSRTIVRMTDATPDVHIAFEVTDLTQGKQLILEGKASGLLLLPQDLEQNVKAAQRPEVVFFYDNQHMSAGSVVSRGASNALATAAAGMRISLRTGQGLSQEVAQAAISPIALQVNPLFNPSLDYTQFLLAALLPAVLQIFIATTSAYSLGLDVASPHRLRVLRRLGGGVWPAIAGKLLPYTLVFMLVFGIADAVLFGYLEVPVRGSVLLLVFGTFLFVLATQLIGSVLALMLLNMETAISMIALLMAPAFGFMGIGFPRLGMNAFANFWGSIIPGTWYTQLRIDQTVRGAPVDVSAYPLAILMLFVLMLTLVGFLRIEQMRRRRSAAVAQRLQERQA